LYDYIFVLADSIALMHDTMLEPFVRLGISKKILDISAQVGSQDEFVLLYCHMLLIHGVKRLLRPTIDIHLELKDGEQALMYALRQKQLLLGMFLML